MVEAEDPEEDDEKIDNPVKIILDEIAQGANVPQIQLAQERKLAKESSTKIKSSMCECGLLLDDDQCNCVGQIDKQNPLTHSLVEIAQSIETDKFEGTIRNTFLIQKVADYETFIEE